MRIAVNTRILLREPVSGSGHFLYELLDRITLEHPEHHFIFLFDQAYDNKFQFAANVSMRRWWFDFRLPHLLKILKADIFFSLDGNCRITTSVPQFMLIPETAGIRHSKRLAKALAIGTLSLSTRNELPENLHVNEEKIIVLPIAVKEIFRKFSLEEKQSCKEKFTSGKEYFIYADIMDPNKNLLNLLKAFSIFKKKQRSNMKLVFAGKPTGKKNDFDKKIKSYKYREDVIIANHLSETETALLVGSAYAMIHPSLHESVAIPALESMTCGIPLIIHSGSAMEELAGDAALYADTAEPDDIADKMMAIYKNERQRSELIHKGLAISDRYSWNKSVAACWNWISSNFT